MNSFKASICAAFVFAVAVGGCKLRLNRSRDANTDLVQSAPSAPVKAAANVTPAPSSAIPPIRRMKPTGPSFAVEAGAGIGPIRFGSTVATVERHMQAKCEELTDKYCRYISSGMDLELTDGAVSGMVIHRYNRPVAGSPGKTWGTFAGGIPPRTMMMMVPDAVIEDIGKPKRTEEVTGDNPYDTVRRDTYDGMILEYDKNRANGRLMLGAIRIVKH
jgi:hypothetical protein